MVGLLVGIVVASVAMLMFGREHPAVTLLVLFPLIASGLLDPARVAVVSAAMLAGAVVVLVDLEAFGNPERLSRVFILGAVGVVSTWMARVRVARENRLRQVTRVAETAQRAIIRAVPTALGRVALAARYLSAADDALVGGDLYEVSASPYGLRVIVGDVRGKGLAAVNLAAVVLGAFRFESMHEPSLPALAQRLDEVVRAEVTRSGEPEDFVTAVLVEIDEDLTARVVACGHPSPLVVDATDAHLLEVLTTNPPLGLCETTKAEHTRWAPGTRVLLYTDGLVEARDRRGRFFPIEREADTLRAPDMDHSLDAVVDHVLTHAGGHLDDDLALVLLECR